MIVEMGQGSIRISRSSHGSRLDYGQRFELRLLALEMRFAYSTLRYHSWVAELTPIASVWEVYH